jgi:hypothetical protein
MSKLGQQKDELIVLSESQRHPARALAQEFQVGTPADNAKSTVPGCFNLTDSEYRQACDESDKLSHRKETSGHENSPVAP